MDTYATSRASFFVLLAQSCCSSYCLVDPQFTKSHCFTRCSIKKALFFKLWHYSFESLTIWTISIDLSWSLNIWLLQICFDWYMETLCCRQDYSTSWDTWKPSWPFLVMFSFHTREYWLVIAEKYLKLPTHLASRCVCEVPGDEGSIFLGAAVTQLRLCKYKLQRDALSLVYLQWSFSLQSHLLLGISFVLSLNFYPLFAKKCPHMHVSLGMQEGV